MSGEADILMHIFNVFVMFNITCVGPDCLSDIELGAVIASKFVKKSDGECLLSCVVVFFNSYFKKSNIIVITIYEIKLFTRLVVKVSLCL